MGRILDLIPITLHAELFTEVEEELKKKSKTEHQKADPELIAYAKKQNEKAIEQNQRNKSH